MRSVTRKFGEMVRRRNTKPTRMSTSGPESEPRVLIEGDLPWDEEAAVATVARV